MSDWEEDESQVVASGTYNPSYNDSNQWKDRDDNGFNRNYDRNSESNHYNSNRSRGWSRGRRGDSFGGRRGRGGGYNQRGSSYNNSSWRNSNDGRNFNGSYHSSSYQNDKQGNESENATNAGRQMLDWATIRKQNEEAERKKFEHLPKIVKNNYVECDEVKNMTQKEADKIRASKNSITVSYISDTKSDRILNPVTEFRHAFDFHANIMEKIEAQGFATPSPIQCQLWPLLMSGQDVVGIAQTGTGKTLAYLLPGFLHIEAQPYFEDPERRGPLMLVLAPTRELAQQIYEESLKFSYKGIKSACVYGQGNYGDQCRALRRGVEIVVATPGRLNDFISKEIVNLNAVSYLVLDEADRMLDMGFQPDILKICCHIRKDRQVVLTSATWPTDVEYIANRLMENAVKVQVGLLDLAAASTVTQYVRVCEEDDKVDMLVDVLSNLTPEDKVIAFVNKKAVVDYVSVLMNENNIECRVMHGGIEQCDRESALEDLKQGDCRILLATDVASRGIDITDLTLVINMDLPKNLEEYVHRSGRTGRAGRAGEVISFVTWSNRGQAQELIEILERSSQEVPDDLKRLAERAKRYSDNSRGRGRGGGRRGDGGYGRRSEGGHGRSNGGYGRRGSGRDSYGTSEESIMEFDFAKRWT